MDIGGIDILVPTTVSKDTQIRLALSFLRGIWPDGVMDLDNNELLFYQNIDVKRDWDKNGQTKENDDKMIHVISGDKYLTMVFAGKTENWE